MDQSSSSEEEKSWDLEDELFEEKLDLCQFYCQLGQKQLLQNAQLAENYQLAAEIASGKYMFRLNHDMCMTEFLPDEGAGSNNPFAVRKASNQVNASLKTVNRLEQIL